MDASETGRVVVLTGANEGIGHGMLTALVENGYRVAGLDYPAYFWELATEGEVTAEQDYQPGTASHLLRGEAVHLHSVLREEYPLTPRPSGAETTWDIARSLVEQPRFDYLSLDDPAPFVRDLTNAGRSMVPLL